MKKAFWPFILGFLIPFLTTTSALYVTSARFEMLGEKVLLQCLMLIGALSVLVGLFTAFSSATQELSPEQEGFQPELSRELGTLIRAIWVLKRPAFFPFWLVLATLVFGTICISRGYAISGSMILLTAQAFWLLARNRLNDFLNFAPIDNDLCPYLLWVLRGMDFYAIIAAAYVLEALGSYGEIVDNLQLMLASAFLAAVYVGVSAFRKKESIDMDHFLQGAAVFLWVALVAATINFGFDFRAPLHSRRLIYRQCAEYRDLVLSGKTQPQTTMLDCHYFSRLREPHTDSTIEFVHRAGALGVEWKKGHFIN